MYYYLSFKTVVPIIPINITQFCIIIEEISTRQFILQNIQFLIFCAVVNFTVSTRCIKMKFLVRSVYQLAIDSYLNMA